MSASTTNPVIVPRKAPDFGFDDTLPKYWFAGDPSKTRFFDAMSTMFPEGEKYFIESVRAYRDQITDPAMKEAVRDFTYQEAQHSIAHGLFNDRLRAQGIDVDRFERSMQAYFTFLKRYMPKSVNLANTAVAFDVLQKVAKVGYVTRIASMAYESIGFPISVHLFMDNMLRADGFGAWERARMWARGLRWLYGPGGLMHSLLPSYLSYYRADFHPWQEGQMETYHEWRRVYESTCNPIDAANAVSQP